VTPNFAARLLREHGFIAAVESGGAVVASRLARTAAGAVYTETKRFRPEDRGQISVLPVIFWIDESTAEAIQRRITERLVG